MEKEATIENVRTTSIDRRIIVHYSCHKPAKISFTVNDTQQVIDTVILDISQSGARISSKTQLPAQILIHLALPQIGSSLPQISLSAQVQSENRNINTFIYSLIFKTSAEMAEKLSAYFQYLSPVAERRRKERREVSAQVEKDNRFHDLRERKENVAEIQSAENFTLADFIKVDGKRFEERINFFNDVLEEEISHRNVYYMREICGPTGREVKVRDPYTGKIKNMLMFGSNNYLGFANHPFIKKKVLHDSEEFGMGLGGPPLLNGTTSLHKLLESKLSQIKNKEAAIIFPSGYSANVGLASALIRKKDIVIFDEFCHASFIDGLNLGRIKFRSYKHNNIEDLKKQLDAVLDSKDVFVATEGVFSMDGDISKLDEIIALKNKYKFYLIVDDSHGLGVIGENGHGIHEYFHTDKIDVIMGTFSKTLAMTGGFVAANNEIIDYLRYFARSYMFSASLPPLAVSAILAGLELLDTEKWRIKKLKENVSFLLSILQRNGIHAKTDSAIVSIIVPSYVNIRNTSKLIHDEAIFLNTVEYPAVPLELQRFRISLMTEHTEDDIKKLSEVLVKTVGN